MDRMTEEIRRVGNYAAGTDDAEVWNSYVQYFTGLPAFNRQQVLTWVDEDVMGNIPVVNKDAGKLLQHRRELGDLNQRMIRAGR